jgi:hypothetical protein
MAFDIHAYERAEETAREWIVASLGRIRAAARDGRSTECQKLLAWTRKRVDAVYLSHQDSDRERQSWQALRNALEVQMATYDCAEPSIG